MHPNCLTPINRICCCIPPSLYHGSLDIASIIFCTSRCGSPGAQYNNSRQHCLDRTYTLDLFLDHHVTHSHCDCSRVQLFQRRRACSMHQTGKSLPSTRSAHRGKPSLASTCARRSCTWYVTSSLSRTTMRMRSQCSALRPLTYVFRTNERKGKEQNGKGRIGKECSARHASRTDDLRVQRVLR